MKSLNDYIGIQYEDGARGPDKLDCWGLVRLVRHEIFDLPLLPSFGHVRHTMPIEFTRAYSDIAKTMQICNPEPGAIAAVMRGKICIHVACVVEISGSLAVIEINPKTNCRIIGLSDFQRQHPKAVYYK